MNRKDLIAALNWLKVNTGSLACFGCGHEHNCGIHGCAIINAAAEKLNVLTEKDTPKPPIRFSRDGMGYTYHDYCCPGCMRTLAYEPEWYKHTHEKYCYRCGQAILWPDGESDGA